MLTRRGSERLPNRSLEEVDDFFVFLVVGIAGYVEGGRSSSMLRKLRKIQRLDLFHRLGTARTLCAQKSGFDTP